MSSHALFAVAPYLAVASLLALTPLRYLLARQRRRLSRRQVEAAFQVFAGNAAWRVGFLALLAGHLLLLLAPTRVLAWNQSVTRLLTLEAALFLSGLVALVGLLALVIVNLRDPETRSLSGLADVALLALLLVGVASGVALAIAYRWAASWSTVTLTPYVQSVVTLHPHLSLVKGMPYLVKLHVFSAVAIVGLLPFTRLIDLLLVLADRGLARSLAPLVALGSWGLRPVEHWARRCAQSLWLHEEEDEVG
jgi:nitrate reductase gamma subunit